MINSYKYGETLIEWCFEEDISLKHHYLTVEKDQPVILRGKVISFKEQLSLIKNKALWIRKKYQQFAAISEEDIVSGSRIKYRGRFYYTQIIKKENTEQVKIEFTHSRFIITIPNSSEDQQKEIKEALKVFFKVKCLEKIKPRIRYWEKLIGLKSNGYRLYKYKGRWASCTTDNILEFNYKCMELTPKLMDYIIVHELIHTIHPDHSKQFWQEVAGIIPNVHELHKTLEWEI